MATSIRSAAAIAPMYLDARLPEGHIVICGCSGGEHSFLVHKLGLAVECPTCGRTALSTELIADFYARAALSLRAVSGRRKCR
jgi:hypothetical protein